MSYIGNSAITSFDGQYAFLSNFYPCNIFEAQEDGTTIVYPTVEHAYQASKTSNIEIKRRVASEQTPGRAKRAGGKRGYVTMDANFEQNKVDIMRRLLVIKFLNQHLQELLISTGQSTLVEGNTWGDQFWGYDIRVGKGSNMLGRLLMDVRDAMANLKSTEPIYFKGLYEPLNPYYSNCIIETQLDGSVIQYPTLSQAFNGMNCTDANSKRMIANYDVCTNPINPYLHIEKARIPYNRNNQTLWEAEKQLMKGLNELKFKQDNFIILLELTGNKELIYSGDTFWGKVNGVGENHLGSILMELREDIRNGKLR